MRPKTWKHHDRAILIFLIDGKVMNRAISWRFSVLEKSLKKYGLSAAAKNVRFPVFLLLER